MKVMIVGGGGREHAIAWKLTHSRHAPKIFCAPGNAGITEMAECVAPVNLAQFAVQNSIDLTIVGPEAPLCAGIVDEFLAKNLRIFGPNKRAAQLEGSKIFAKQFMWRYGIPTAGGEFFDDPIAARAFVRKVGAPVVIKADGLAKGKGVVVAESVEQAERAICDLMEIRLFGEAGARIIVEQCLFGQESSLMALVDGKSYRLLDAAQDYKRARDGGYGPNTGGMGAYSPMLMKLNGARIFDRILAGLRDEGIDYHGVLYAGLILTREGPKVLEFNCRFGDPETQVLVPRMDFDLLEAALATIDGRLDRFKLRWKADATVCVVLVSRGYPTEPEQGRVIEGLNAAGELDNILVFHAGTKRDAVGRVVTNAGRVLGVTAYAGSVAAARADAYKAVNGIHFDGMQYRRDIAAHVDQT